MRKNCVWIAVAMLAPLSLLIGLLVLAPRGVEKRVIEERRIAGDVVMAGRAECAKKYISDNGMGWTHVFLGDGSKTGVPNQDGVQGIPTLILLDPKGEVVYTLEESIRNAPLNSDGGGRTAAGIVHGR